MAPFSTRLQKQAVFQSPEMPANPGPGVPLQETHMNGPSQELHKKGAASGVAVRLRQYLNLDTTPEELGSRPKPLQCLDP